MQAPFIQQEIVAVSAERASGRREFEGELSASRQAAFVAEAPALATLTRRLNGSVGRTDLGLL